MKLKLHAGIKRDIRNAVNWYDKRSDRAGDAFIVEVNTALGRIAADPTHFHFMCDNIRRCNLKRFPYHILFEVHLMFVHVLAVKQHRMHPDFGLKRRRK